MSRHYSSPRYLALLMTSLCTLALVTSCSAGGPVVLELSANKHLLTPDSRGDRVDVTYRVNRPARLSMSVVSKSGVSRALRADEPRRQDETYVYQFDGT